MRARCEALGLLALPFALALLTGPPSPAAITQPVGPDPTAPVVAVLALLAWAGCGWLLLVAGLTAARLDRLASRLAPAAVRTLMTAAVGATALSVLAAPAQAQAPAPAPPAAADLDWPEAPAGPPPAPAQTVRPTGTTPTTTGVVVVQPGDSLWAIAARALGPQPAARAVAEAWPAWWSANRAAIGDDPDLIFPGTALHAPAPNRGEP